MLTNSLNKIKSLITLKRRKPQYRFKSLKQLFVKDGHTYYTFPKELNLPLKRFAETLALQELLSMGISGGQMEEILSLMEKSIHSGLSNPKNASTVATCVHLIRSRKDQVIHKDLLLNIAAIWIVRDDEPIEEISIEIHNEKLALFERMAGEDSHGFFTIMDLPILAPLLSMSAKDFKELWDDNRNQSKILADQLAMLSLNLDKSHQSKGSRSMSN